MTEPKKPRYVGSGIDWAEYVRKTEIMLEELRQERDQLKSKLGIDASICGHFAMLLGKLELCMRFSLPQTEAIINDVRTGGSLHEAIDKHTGVKPQ
jgi:hypothetical protein